MYCYWRHTLTSLWATCSSLDPQSIPLVCSEDAGCSSCRFWLCLLFFAFDAPFPLWMAFSINLVGIVSSASILRSDKSWLSLHPVKSFAEGVFLQDWTHVLLAIYSVSSRNSLLGRDRSELACAVQVPILKVDRHIQLELHSCSALEKSKWLQYFLTFELYRNPCALPLMVCA